MAAKKNTKNSKPQAPKENKQKMKNPMVLLLIVLAIAIVALLILLSLPQSTPSSTSAPVEETETPTWAELVQASSAADDELTQYSITYTMDMAISSESDTPFIVSALGNLLVDVPNKMMYSVTDLDMSLLGLPNQKTETYIIDNTIYMNIPDTYSTETVWIVSNSSVDFWELMESSSLKDQVNTLMAAMDGEVLETTTVDGEKVYKTLISFDAEDLMELLSEYGLMDSLGYGLDSEETVQLLGQMIEKMDMTLYIRASDYMTIKGELEMILTSEGIASLGSSETIMISAELDFDYESPVIIELPEEALESNMTLASYI